MYSAGRLLTTNRWTDGRASLMCRSRATRPTARPGLVEVATLARGDAFGDTGTGAGGPLRPTSPERPRALDAPRFSATRDPGLSLRPGCILSPVLVEAGAAAALSGFSAPRPLPCST